jgi:uncharacterized membrane protein YbhN (UPF0104 family)
VRSFSRRRRADYLRVLAAQLAARAAGWGCTTVALAALGAKVSFGTAAVVHAALNVAEYLLLVVPARLGVVEGSAFFVFGLLGLDPALGVMTALLLRLRSLAANLLFAPGALGR